MVLMMVRQEAGPCERQPKRRSWQSWKTTLESPETQSDNWQSDSLKNIQVTLSQGKKKKGDEVDDEDDDAMRTRQSDSDTMY